MRYNCQIVLDLEFNPVSFENRSIIRDEIVEIGAIKFDADMNIIDRFSTYVRPRLNDVITEKIIRLTGIRTSDVLGAPEFKDALAAFADWAGESRCRIITWSNTDLAQIRKECIAKCVAFPQHLNRWLDFQSVYGRIINYSRKKPISLKKAAYLTGIPFDNLNAHRAMYDTELTFQLLQRIKDEDYIRSINQAKTYIFRNEQRDKTLLSALCGGALEELMMRLQTA